MPSNSLNIILITIFSNSLFYPIDIMRYSSEKTGRSSIWITPSIIRSDTILNPYTRIIFERAYKWSAIISSANRFIELIIGSAQPFLKIVLVLICFIVGYLTYCVIQYRKSDFSQNSCAICVIFNSTPAISKTISLIYGIIIIIQFDWR